jgi:hypothetical protein
VLWGQDAHVIERFGAAGIAANKINCMRDSYEFHFDGPPSGLLARFRTFYGPTMNAFEAAEKNGKAGDLQRELEALFESQNKSADKNRTMIPATFLRVTVQT